MKKILQKHLAQLIMKVILFLLPFGIGFVGFLSVDDESPLWAAYHSIRLYSLNTDITDLNPLIEIARWLAPVAMCTTLIVLVRSIWTKIQYRLRSLSNKSVSVYGNNSDSEKLLSILGKKVSKVIWKNHYLTNTIFLLLTMTWLLQSSWTIMLLFFRKNVRFIYALMRYRPCRCRLNWLQLFRLKRTAFLIIGVVSLQ